MRKSKPKKRIILPDPIYHDVLVTRFVNNLMLDGKKTTAYAIFYDAMKAIEKGGIRNRFLTIPGGTDLPNAYDSLNEGGRIIIRDGIKTTGSFPLTIRFRTPSGLDFFKNYVI